VCLLLTSCVVAGEVGTAASGQVTAGAGPAATPSSLLPSEPERPPVAANVVSGEYLTFLSREDPPTFHAAGCTVVEDIVQSRSRDVNSSGILIGLQRIGHGETRIVVLFYINLHVTCCR
jgi:hypothetical protein